MKILYEKPPIFDEVAKVFDIRGRAVIFAYGDAIYNPYNAGISDDLEVHEGVHLVQQARMGGPEVWWERYLRDTYFRLEQELEAYQAQYAYFCRMEKSRTKRFDLLTKCARDLSSPMYRCGISYADAVSAIRNGIK